MSEKPWLTIKEVVKRLRAAGYTDSPDTVRRAVDAGRYGTEGTDWYRTESGYRLVAPPAIDRLVERRRNPPSAKLSDRPDVPAATGDEPVRGEGQGGTPSGL